MKLVSHARNSSARRRVRVLVADDHPVSLDGLARAIKAWPEFELIDAVTTDALLPALRELQPDVTVFDPTFLGGEARDEVFACASDEVRLLFVSDDYGKGSYDAAVRGAVGCLTRLCSAQELRHAVAAADRGEVHLASAAVEEIAAELRLRNRYVGPYLTPRQREVLQLVAEGHSNKEVAVQLTIAEATVKAHLRSIYKELGVRGRTQASAVGLRHHLID
jgi:two-component system nitrate/nitrite response regulator NarL